MAVNNPEWRDAWPEGPEATLFFTYIAHFHYQSILDGLKTPLEGEADIGPTPELDRRIQELIAKARRKEAWNKRKVALKKAATVAAIVIVCLLATPTVMFAVSPDFRETVYNYIVDWREGHVNVNRGRQSDFEQGFVKYYVPAFIPEGFILEDYADDAISFELYYSNGEQYFYFITNNIVNATTLDTETANISFDYRVNGLPAIISENRNQITILWHDDVTAFQLLTTLPLATALDIAASYTLQENFL